MTAWQWSNNCKSAAYHIFVFRTEGTIRGKKSGLEPLEFWLCILLKSSRIEFYLDISLFAFNAVSNMGLRWNQIVLILFVCVRGLSQQTDWQEEKLIALADFTMKDNFVIYPLWPRCSGTGFKRRLMVTSLRKIQGTPLNTWWPQWLTEGGRRTWRGGCVTHRPCGGN